MAQLPVKLTAKEPVPVLKILNGSLKGKQLRLLSSQITIGRDNRCDVVFKDDPSCSRHHARIAKKGKAYLIESLNPKNPVLVNKKVISSKLLQPKDQILIGKVNLMFSTVQRLSPAVRQEQALIKPGGSSATRWLNPPRLILIVVLIAGAFLFLSEDKKSQQKEQGLKLKTEADILEELEEIKKSNTEEDKKIELDFKQETARKAFIQGFRDYRKGYFYRALNKFQHCLTINKANALCHRYTRKAQSQIDYLIQKKIRLGNAYKANKQYEACQAAFKSVETMIQDSSHAVYKEAKAKKESCAIQLKNKI